MKLLFRRKSDGRILQPIQTLDAYVRLQQPANKKVFRAPTSTLPQFFTVHSHDIERGDVLRDIRDGQLWVVEYVGLHGLRLKSGIFLRGMTYFGLVNYERVGRKYHLRDRQTNGRSSAIADAVNRVTHDVAQKTRVDFTRYDSHQVQAKMGRAVHEIINRFDAVTNAQRHAQEYGVGFIRVAQDGSMKAIDPRSVILK